MNRLTEQVHGAASASGRWRSAGRSSCCWTTRGARPARWCSTSAPGSSWRCAPAPRCWPWAAGPTMYRIIACSADKSADGIALAYRAGLPLRDMEMIQFHPDRPDHPGLADDRARCSRRGCAGPADTCATGGASASWSATTRRGWSAPRATSSRARRSWRWPRGAGRPNGGVWIDVSHLGAEVVERNFRGMVRRCRDFGRDLAREPVEVGPTTHFMMGGVVIDPACRTAIEGLFAAGEDTGGVHGANRLGGNGVAESTVFGGIAGDVMAAFVEGRRPPRASRPPRWPRSPVASTAPLGRTGRADLYALQREPAGDHVGPGRPRARRRRACGRPSRRSSASAEALDDVGRGRRPRLQHGVAGLAQPHEPGDGGAADRRERARAHARAGARTTAATFPRRRRHRSTRCACAGGRRARRVWTEPVAFTRMTPPVASRRVRERDRRVESRLTDGRPRDVSRGASGARHPRRFCGASGRRARAGATPRRACGRGSSSERRRWACSSSSRCTWSIRSAARCRRPCSPSPCSHALLGVRSLLLDFGLSPRWHRPLFILALALAAAIFAAFWSWRWY